MGVATLTSKGQITIPKEVRKALELESGDKVEFIIDGKRAVVIPLKKRSLLELRGSLPATRETPDWHEVRDTTAQAIAERMNKERE
ncbi:MAG: AbrB family transcriptional regulator [Chloroflexi bacterium CG07_land_8_20_14_0_80_51_10]|nr:MAG: AbrB family transcriptional regulator [Chloroflexi bacterium CG07_land_8_20_14_0_80_51_10]